MTKTSQSIDTAIALERVADIKEDVKVLTLKVKDEYVTFVRYNPVEKIVYTMVGFILLAFLGAIVGLVIRQK